MGSGPASLIVFFKICFPLWMKGTQVGNIKPSLGRAEATPSPFSQVEEQVPRAALGLHPEFELKDFPHIQDRNKSI
jgi:hypothetical protein